MADATDAEKSAPVLVLEDVHKSYGTTVLTEVLRDVNLRVVPGELLALTGPSGSGKSTLLNIIGLLDRPTSGKVFVAGEEAGALEDARLTRLRGTKIGFVFQFHHLLPGFSAAENVMMPMVIARGRPRPDMRDRAIALLERVGLADRADARPSELSGGQQQRVAIARALALGAPLILADEPTGNLDTENAARVFALMRELNRQTRQAFVVVTHDARLAQQCDRVVVLVDGSIVTDGPPVASSPSGASAVVGQAAITESAAPKSPS